MNQFQQRPPRSWVKQKMTTEVWENSVKPLVEPSVEGIKRLCRRDGTKNLQCCDIFPRPFPWEEKGCFLQFDLSLEKGALRRTLQELDMCFLERGRAQGTDVWHPSPPPPPSCHPPTAQWSTAWGRRAWKGPGSRGASYTCPTSEDQHHLPSKMLPDPDFSTLLQRTLGQLSHGASQWAVGSGTV